MKIVSSLATSYRKYAKETSRIQETSYGQEKVFQMSLAGSDNIDFKITTLRTCSALSTAQPLVTASLISAHQQVWFPRI